MANPEDVAAYRPSGDRHPWLRKALLTFQGAEVLRRAGKFGCAANRYYFAMVQVQFHFLGVVPEPCDIREYGIRVPGRGEARWPKGALAKAYWKRWDSQADRALDMSYQARKRADYSCLQVQEGTVGRLLQPVCDMIVRAMDREEIPRDHDD